MIRRIKDELKAPVAAYQVSGEYSAIEAAGLNGWLDERAAALETLTAIRRAGADLIVLREGGGRVASVRARSRSRARARAGRPSRSTTPTSG